MKSSAEPARGSPKQGEVFIVVSRYCGWIATGSLVLALVACGEDETIPGGGQGASGLSGTAGSGATIPTGGSGQGATGQGGTGTGTGGTGASGATGGAGACLVDSLLGPLGIDHLAIGASMEDATANSAPFDARYLYLAGTLFDGADPCTSCATGCTSEGASCANSAGCGWWGCWQWDQDPPGQYALNLIDAAEGATYGGSAHPQIPWFTYYIVLQASGLAEGTAEVAAVADAAFLHRYLADWRLLLQRIGTHRAFLHHEPDFWGYAQHLDPDPHAIPAAVTTANPTDCAGMEDSVAGLGRCLIHMVRLYAPNARIGLHASPWATQWSVLQNEDPGFDVVGHAQELADYLLEAGAGESDFIVADMADRDAGWYETQQGADIWWDDTNQSLPNFTQAFVWSKALAERAGKPVVWWQIPVGNMSLSDTYGAYRDNRVDYFFAHPDEVVAAHGAGLMFGAGVGGATTPETDGGNLVAKTIAYEAAGSQPSCP